MITIMNCSPEQISEISVIEEMCFSVPMTQEQIRSQMPDASHVLLTAVNNSNETVGYAGMMHVLDEGYISNIAVRTDSRRQGIAESLLNRLSEEGIALKLSFLTLEVRESNVPAILLYEKNGYNRVGLRKNYYSSPKENALLMTKYLK